MERPETQSLMVHIEYLEHPHGCEYPFVLKLTVDRRWFGDMLMREGLRRGSIAFATTRDFGRETMQALGAHGWESYDVPANLTKVILFFWLEEPRDHERWKRLKSFEQVVAMLPEKTG
jgi:hypothetical protein